MHGEQTDEGRKVTIREPDYFYDGLEDPYADGSQKHRRRWRWTRVLGPDPVNPGNVHRREVELSVHYVPSAKKYFGRAGFFRPIVEHSTRTVPQEYADNPAWRGYIVRSLPFGTARQGNLEAIPLPGDAVRTSKYRTIEACDKGFAMFQRLIADEAIEGITLDDFQIGEDASLVGVIHPDGSFSMYLNVTS